jgi:hypothetical protein
MKRLRFVLAAVLLLAAGAAFAADQVSVNVEKTQVRATASALGKLLGVLAYGDRVTVLEQTADKAWIKVSSAVKALEGWVRASVLQKKEIVMKTGTQSAATSASSGDVTLAGKGFNKEVEAQYKADQKLDYTWVDKMETFTVTQDQVASFYKAGGLKEGGAQ